MPNTDDTNIHKGLSALQQEGAAFWSDLKDSAILNFRCVVKDLELPETDETEANDFVTDSESSDSDVE